MQRAAIACSLVLVLACNSGERKTPAPEPQRSPNANVLPTPLAERSEQLPQPTSSAGSGGAGAGAGGGSSGQVAAEPPPTPFSTMAPPDDDSSLPRLKDAQWFSLQAVWRWAAADPGPLEPEVNRAFIAEARKKPAAVKIDLHPGGRMRWQWTADAFPLPEGSELLARYANYGHVLSWQNGKRYRVLGPGVLRATLAEHRADVTPLMLGELIKHNAGKRLGLLTQLVELQTPHGTLLLEQALQEDTGNAGPLLCRTLVELIAVSPTTVACAPGRLPLYAEIRLAAGGHSSFEVTGISHKVDPAPRFAIPPPAARFQVSGLPARSSLLLDAAEQQQLHSHDRPPPEEGPRDLVAQNPTPSLAYLLLDQVPAALLDPFTKVRLIGLRPGRYRAQWHDFFGRALREPTTIDVPSEIASVLEPLSPDAGAPAP